MRIRAKKIGAIIISALLLTQLVPNMAWGAESPNIISSTVTISATDPADAWYEVQRGGKLMIAANGNVQGRIDVLAGGTVIIEDGGTVSGTINLNEGENLYEDFGGTVTIQSGGTASGTINIDYGTVTVESGGCAQSVKMTSTNAICNNQGTIDEMTVATGSYSNDGYTGTLTLDAVTNEGSAVVYMNSGSLIDTLTYTPITESGNVKCKIKIDASIGARIQSLADVYSDCLKSDSFPSVPDGSSGTIYVVSTGVLKLNGSSPFPSRLKFEVASEDIRINNNMSSSAGVCSVVCGGKTYPLPVATSTEASISTMYGTVIDTNGDAIDDTSEIALSELTAGYGAEEVEEKTITIGPMDGANAANMNCRITHIPEYVTVSDGNQTLSTESGENTIALRDPTMLTVKVKTGNVAGVYDDSLTFALETNEVENDGVNGISDIVLREVSIPISLTVNHKTGSGNIVVDDIHYGESIDPVVTSTANGTENVTIEYKTKDADNSAYTTEKPTRVGEYTARATFAETGIYFEATATDDFSIMMAAGSGSIEVADIYYGGTLNPVVTSDANGTENVTIEYKTKGADDSAYTTEEPTRVGEYTARATFAETDGYLATTATDDFSILKKTGSGTIAVADIYYGETLDSVVTSDTNGTDHVTIEYKEKGAEDSNYTTVKPTKAGEYTARATFAETDIYAEATATDDFTITYLPVPTDPYSIQGTLGEKEYYTSTVSIVPAEGYLIADSVDGEYSDALTVNQSTEGFMIYLKNKETGEITSGIEVPAFRIDNKAPTVLNAVSGQTIYGDQAEIIVKDENLSQVLVNGEAVEIKDNQATLKLSSNGGEEKYEIVSTDIAGNQTKIQITVAAEWMKKKLIPSGVKVRLSQECAYILGNGTWKVSGDGTEYSGGNTFYVRNDGEYSFTNVDE